MAACLWHASKALRYNSPTVRHLKRAKGTRLLFVGNTGSDIPESSATPPATLCRERRFRHVKEQQILHRASPTQFRDVGHIQGAKKQWNRDSALPPHSVDSGPSRTPLRHRPPNSGGQDGRTPDSPRGRYKELRAAEILRPSLVSEMRFELTQPFGHYPLKVACLPISPPGRIFTVETRTERKMR